MNIQKTFFLNGHKFLYTKELTLNQIIEYFGFQNFLFIIEYNNLICNQDRWKEIKIKSNDTIEIISIVGGG